MPRDQRLRSWLLAGATALVAGSAALWWGLRPTAVTVQAVVRGRAVEAVYATGTVEPVERVVVKAPLGEHLERLYVAAGDAVSRGQLLASLENPVRAYALSQGQTQLARARQQAGAGSPQLAGLEAQIRALRAQLELARIELARSAEMRARAALPQQDLDVARYRVQQLAAQTQAAEDQLRSARLELGATRDQLASQVRSLSREVEDRHVRAPIAGVVLRRYSEPGEIVAPQQPLFELADTSTLLVELRVDEADIARVRDGPEPSRVALSFHAFPGRAFAGTVARILPEPDRMRRAYTVKVALDQPIPGLRVGMTAEANIVVQRRDGVLLLPLEALDGEHAWLVEEGRAVRRKVATGNRDLTRVEVRSGVREGALAIVDAAAHRLAEGEKVSVAGPRGT